MWAASDAGAGVAFLVAVGRPPLRLPRIPARFLSPGFPGMVVVGVVEVATVIG